MKLYLVRHGQTEANERKVFQGWLDLHLSDTGRQEARNISKLLEIEEFQRICVSPLARTLETAEIIHAGLKKPMPLTLVEELREMNFGQWEGLSSDEIALRYPVDYAEWLQNWQTTRTPEGESAVEVYQRVTGWLKGLQDELAHNYSEGQKEIRGTGLSDGADSKILIVTHQGVILQLIAHLLGMGLAGSWHFQVRPGSLSVVEIIQDHTTLIKLNHL